jgi:hypothetical protein
MGVSASVSVGGDTGVQQTGNAQLDASLAATAQMNAQMAAFQTSMTALTTMREAQTAAFNAANRAMEEVQSR